MTGHICSNVTWTTWVNLNASLQNFLISTQYCAIKVNSKLWNSINPFCPSSLFNFTFGDSILKLFNQFVKFFFSKIGVFESVFNFFILNSVEGHFSCTWTNSNNFSIVCQEWKDFFRKINSTIEILDLRK